MEEISQQWYFSTLPEKEPWPPQRPRERQSKVSASATPLTAAPSTGILLVRLGQPLKRRTGDRRRHTRLRGDQSCRPSCPFPHKIGTLDLLFA